MNETVFMDTDVQRRSMIKPLKMKETVFMVHGYGCSAVNNDKTIENELKIMGNISWMFAAMQSQQM